MSLIGIWLRRLGIIVLIMVYVIGILVRNWTMIFVSDIGLCLLLVFKIIFSYIERIREIVSCLK